MAPRNDVGRARRRRTGLVALAVTAALLAAGCESAVVGQINGVRTAAGVPTLPIAGVTTETARANSAAMCAAGAASPSADPAEVYDQETAAAVHELVGSAPLDPSLTDWGQRNGRAANEIWASWQGDPALADARWDDVAVGEHECVADGRLYSTAVLRDAPTMPATGMYSTIQYTQAQIQVTNGVEYGTAVDYQGTTVPLRLDVYRPPSTGPRPLVVLIHGGGFHSGDRANMATAAIGYARRGYVVAAISYRLDPRVITNESLLLGAATNAIDDGMESVRWLRANASAYDIDSTRIAALGTSAGGVIALGLAAADDPTPGGPLAGVARTIDAAVSTGGHLTPGIEADAVTFEATDAPAMMFHYETDSTTGDTDEYAFETCAALRAGGTTCDFNVQAGSGHTTTISAGGTNWPTEIGPFLWHHLAL